MAVGNFAGARKCWLRYPVDQNMIAEYEQKCICAVAEKDVIPLREIVFFLMGDSYENGI